MAASTSTFAPVQVARSVLWSALLPALVVLPLALVACGPSSGPGNGAGKGAGGPGGAGGAGGPPGGMPPPQVAVVTVEAKSQSVQLEYVGQTAGSRETEVRSRVAGILQKRLYQEGASVRAGDALFQIDPANFQTQLASTEAAVSVAQAKLNQARRDLARLAPLIAEKAISQKEYDDSQSAVESAEATLKQVQAQANEAKLNLGYTTVVAPIGGTTSTVNKSDGSLVTAGDSLLTTIVQTNPMYVNFSVSESDLLRMNKQLASGQLDVPGKRAANGSLGFTVSIKLADGSLYPRTGKLNFASEKVNPQTGSVELRAEVPNPDGSLRPGQFVRVLLGGASRPNAISVPQRAVIDSPFGKMVFVVTPDNKLSPRPLELDGWANGEWLVTKGLQSGDRVLVDGFIKAHDPGMTVTPVPYVAADKAADKAKTGEKPEEKQASGQSPGASSASK